MKRGTNSALMKEHNKKLILNLIRQERLSRANIANRIGLTRASVTILMEELMREGFVAEEESDYAGVGRRPVYLTLRKDAGYAIGVNISRHAYRLGLANLAGELLETRECRKMERQSYEIVREIAAQVRYLADKAKGARIIGVGVSAPGPVDYKTNTILNPPNFPVWHNCEIGRRLSELSGLPVRLENVANAAALAESYFGGCTNEENYAFLMVDEGIGSGIVTGGKLYRGKNGYGNELGHTSIRFDGLPCECGNTGCLEAYASIPNLLKGTPYATWREASEDAELVRREAGYLSCAIVSLVNLFDLNRIVLGGDIVENGEPLARMIEEEVNGRIITNNHIVVCLCRPVDKAAVAASIALNSLFR